MFQELHFKLRSWSTLKNKTAKNDSLLDQGLAF